MDTKELKKLELRPAIPGFGAHIRQRRLQLGYSVREIAEYAGMDQSRLYQIEGDKCATSYALMQRLCAVLVIDMPRETETWHERWVEHPGERPEHRSERKQVASERIEDCPLDARTATYAEWLEWASPRYGLEGRQYKETYARFKAWVQSKLGSGAVPREEYEDWAKKQRRSFLRSSGWE